MNAYTPTSPTVAAAHALERARLAALRRAIADRIEADLALLDALDGDLDLDLEPTADAELTASEWTGRGAHRFNVGVAA